MWLTMEASEAKLRSELSVKHHTRISYAVRTHTTSSKTAARNSTTFRANHLPYKRKQSEKSMASRDMSEGSQDDSCKLYKC